MKKTCCASAFYFCFIVILNLTNAYASGIQPLWSKDLKTTINWQKVTPLGQLMLCTGKGIIGVDTKTGDELWVIEELKNSPENSYLPVKQSPFISLSSAEDRNSLYIIDPLNGKILFSSKAAGLEKVTDKFFLYQDFKILVIGNSSSKTTDLVMADMVSGKKLWSKSGDFSFTTAAKGLGNDEVLITSAFFATKIKASTGEELWKTPIDPRTAGMANLLGKLEGFAAKQITKEDVMAQLITPANQPGLFIIAAQKKNESTKTDSKGAKTVSISYSSVYMAFELATGKHKWAAVVELPNQLGISYPANDGLLVCAGNGGSINMLNYNDGTKMLGKRGGGLGLKGPATGIAPLGDGKLLVVSDQGSNSSLTVLDPKTGLLTFDKAVKLKGTVSYTELLPGGILVGSDKEVNLLNTTSGEWYFENAVEGGAGLIASDNESVYLFNTKDGLAYQMDLKATALKPLNTTPIKFQGKEEPGAIEIINNEIVLTSDQNLAGIDKKGVVKFNSYFPSPTLSDFKKALLIASAVKAAYYTAVMTTYSAAVGVSSQAIQVKDSQTRAAKDITANVSGVLGEAAVTGANYTMAYIKMAQQRFKATTQTQNYMLVMTAESKKDIRLLQVSKSTGAVMNTITIGKDKDPVYDVDMIDGKLYYLKEASTLVCYQFGE